MTGEQNDAQGDSATLDELEGDIDLVDAAMTHVADGHLDAADAALATLVGSTDRVDDSDEGQPESPVVISDLDQPGDADGGPEIVPDQPFRPAS